MDITKENANPNPRDGANPLSILFFTYTLGMFKKGYSKTLEVDDLYSPIKSDRSQILGDRLERKWNKHLENIKKAKKTKNPSLLKVLVATFWPEYLYLGVLLAFMDLFIRLVQPIMLGNLLDYFRPNSKVPHNDALWYAGAIVMLNALSALFINQYIMGAFHYGMKVRAACCALIYRKALRLSKNALADTSTGKIVNLLSNDVSRFEIASSFLHQMWISPIASVIVAYFLYRDAGYAGLIGIIPVFLVMLLQCYTGRLSGKYRKQTAQKTDQRVRLMDEIVNGVQVIKMYAWEKAFAKLIKLMRKSELQIISKSSYLRGLFMTFNLFTTRVSLFCTLVTIVFTTKKFTATQVFVLITYFNILAYTMSAMIVRGMSEIWELIVAIRRIQEFMTSEEKQEQIFIEYNSSNEETDDVIVASDLYAKWNMAISDDTLTNLNFNVRKAELLAIIGPVGSGKSSFLQNILGELNIVAGNLRISGTVSYASQDPWVFGATIRQNITFGTEFDFQRYNEVIRACCLHKDLQQFPESDLTIVGDRGASLSGGQKARINLARAIYRDADIYLLDDPLSAVDIHVAKHIYQECIEGFLADKTRILVTHQVHHLKNADHIIILNNGEIENSGSYSELSKSDTVYAQLLTDQDHDEIEQNTENETSDITEMTIEENKVTVKDLQEETSLGKVQGSLLLIYFLIGSNTCCVLILFHSCLLTQVIVSSVDWFISFWVKLEENRSNSSNFTESFDITSPSLWPREIFVYVYSGLIGAVFFVALFRSLLFYKLSMKSSQKLHDHLFQFVINASMRFFDVTPSGRILNRFSKDIGSIDELLPRVTLDAGQFILNIIGSVALVVWVNPYFIAIVAIVSIFFLLLRAVYLRTSQNIKRLEGIMKSPIFTHLNATLQGLTTVRAFGAEDILRDEFDKHQDRHSSAFFMYLSASSAFGFFLDFLCFIFVSLVTFSFLTIGESLGFSGSEVGLAITQAIALTGLLQWGIRQSAEVSNQLMSVERVLQYKNILREKQPEEPKALPTFWPHEGRIRFKSVSLKYYEDGPLVLNRLNIWIQAEDKVGVVGRTGAGKSSLIAALFRTAAEIGGEVEIDGFDTKDLELQVLRSHITVIPQDPVLFSGTLRYNLDPFEEYSDELLYRALNDVELKDPENRLENRVMDRGSNYSVGQRQLICLARAIIRNNKILVLDEATANVDPQTDAIIQRTIKEKFAKCTVITIAHRLNTIIDSDKVLVMENGTKAEYDHPHLLLKNRDSIFSKMVAETGRASAEEFRVVAETNFKLKYDI